MDLEPYDFGPVYPDECCDNNSETVNNESPVKLNFVLIAFDDGDRKFTVSLHQNGTWSFSFTNGDPFPEELRNKYCSQISAAQSKLEALERWRRNGRDIGIWDPDRNFGTPGSGGKVTYFPAGSSGSNGGDCSILPKAVF